MSPLTDTQKRIGPIIASLLAGPQRPGQAFTMPGANHDGIYRMARRLKAFVETTTDTVTAIGICSDDRALVAATLLATLADGPVGILPHDLSAEGLKQTRRQTGFTHAVAAPDTPLPAGVTRIDVDGLTDMAESLQGKTAPAGDRVWLRIADGGDGGLALWSKSPRALLTETDDFIRRFSVGSGDRILATVGPREVVGLVFSVLLPMLASTRVASATPTSEDEFTHQLALLSPTLLVFRREHRHLMNALPPGDNALRLAVCGSAPLSVRADDAPSVPVVEVYGTPATGSIATRCRAEGETAFTPDAAITWRIAGGSLDVRSPRLSPELPIRDSGWCTVADGVQPHEQSGFIPSEPQPDGDQHDEQPTTPGGTQAMITIEPVGRSIAVRSDQTLQALAAIHGLDIRADCGGAGICGKCRVWVHPADHFSPPTPSERKVLTAEQLAEGSRLACQAKALGEGTVTIPDSLKARAEARGKAGITGKYPVDPTIRRLTVSGQRPDVGQDNVPESLTGWLAGQADLAVNGRTGYRTLRQLGRYRGSLETFTLVTHVDEGLCRIVDGHHPRSLGLAVDLGTTSVAGYLCDLNEGTILTADACVNPQRRFGEDVISRICHINERAEHLEQLQRLAAEGINTLMKICFERIGADPESIDDIAICGNTTMEQIAAGLDPHNLGMSPYFPLSLVPPSFNAGDLGLACDGTVPVYLVPVMSGFVGGDTMAAILADRPHERDEVTLIVDIGTNGEIVLGNRDGLWVTSCATGPALEGAQISCGMRAVTGAIHRVWPNDAGTGLDYEVLGDEENPPALGICGSGIIDAIAGMRRIGAIMPSGRLDPSVPGVESDADGIGRRYLLVPGNGKDNGVAVTLPDVRQIQLAKSALSVGIEFLMRKAGIARIERTVLTGAFGAHFNWQNALAIGMLPPAVADSRVVAKYNLAGVGVVMALLDRRRRIEATRLCRNVRYLELASQLDFAMAFAQGTGFPELAAPGK